MNKIYTIKHGRRNVKITIASTGCFADSSMTKPFPMLRNEVANALRLARLRMDQITCEK